MAGFDAPFGGSSDFGLSGGMDDIGTSPDAFAKRRSRIVTALVNGETGVQYEALALFAEPLFTLYDLDPIEAFALRTSPQSVSDETVALLETARVLWAFFSLSTSDRAHRRQALASQLVGEDPSEEEWLDLDGLIEATEIHWQALLPEEITTAQTTDHPTLDFDALIHHPAFRVEADPDPSHAGYGTGELSETEARALFAQPLLDDPEVLLDEDAFSDVMRRADVYWHAGRNGLSVAEALDALGTDETPRETEATMMLARYAELFPEHSGAS